MPPGKPTSAAARKKAKFTVASFFLASFFSMGLWLSCFHIHPAAGEDVGTQGQGLGIQRTSPDLEVEF